MEVAGSQIKFFVDNQLIADTIDNQRTQGKDVSIFHLPHGKL